MLCPSAITFVYFLKGKERCARRSSFLRCLLVAHQNDNAAAITLMFKLLTSSHVELLVHVSERPPYCCRPCSMQTSKIPIENNYEAQKNIYKETTNTMYRRNNTKNKILETCTIIFIYQRNNI